MDAAHGFDIEPHYHLYAPSLNPNADGLRLGRDVLARHVTSRQAVILKAFRKPWRAALTEDQKVIWRSVKHPALFSFLRTEASLGHGTLYAYHAYQFETLGDAALALRQAVSYNPATYAGLFRDVADALHTLADMGLHHGAINPESIVWTRADGRLRIKDFGLGLALGEEFAKGLDALRPCMAYLAPEVFDSLVQGRDPSRTAAADMYALGAVMHEFFFGRAPLDLQALATAPTRDLILKTLAGELALAEDWSNLPILTAVIHRCLHPDPAARYSTFAALANDLKLASESLLEPAGDDALGKKFNDVRGNEWRVLPPAVTVSQPSATTGRVWRQPDWTLDAGTRTVIRTPMSGLVQAALRDVPAATWEFYFVQALADLVQADTDGGFVTHLGFLRVERPANRVVLLYPTLRPRPGLEAGFVEWLAHLEKSGSAPMLAPEVRRYLTGTAADPSMTPAAARQAALYALARLFYACLTKETLLTAASRGSSTSNDTADELPLAYYVEQSLSVQISEILGSALAANPALRAASAKAVLDDYQQRASKTAVTR